MKKIIINTEKLQLIQRSLLAVFFIVLGIGLSEMRSEQVSVPLLKSTSYFIWVPTHVWSSEKGFVYDQNLERFQIVDNGYPQQVQIVKTDDLPISLVILMQVGGGASRWLPSYADLPLLLGKVAGDTPHDLCFVTFDSKIEEIWHFPLRTDGIEYALTKQQPGDGGAAIKDAISFAVNQLVDEPGEFRRVILLLAQQADHGSHISSADLLKQIGTSSTVVYTVVFSSRNSNSGRSANSLQTDLHSSGLDKTLKSLEKNTAVDASSITGGVWRPFTDRASFNSAVLEIASSIRTAYTLGFQPHEHTNGYHQIKVYLAPQKSEFTIFARSGYWFNNAEAQIPR